MTGCTKVGTQPAGVGGRHTYTIPHTLRYATAEDIAGLNPHLVTQTVVGYMSELTMAFLMKTGPHNEATPELAIVVPTQGERRRQRGRQDHHVPAAQGRDLVRRRTVHGRRRRLLDQRHPQSRPTTRSRDRLGSHHEDRRARQVHRPLLPQEAVRGFMYQYFSSAGANPCILPKHLLAQYPNINNVPYNSLPVGHRAVQVRRRGSAPTR